MRSQSSESRPFKPYDRKAIQESMEAHQLAGSSVECQCFDCLWARHMLEILPGDDEITGGTQSAS